MKKNRIITITCSVVLLISTITTFLYLKATAFSSDGMMDVIVPFSQMIEWISGRWFSLQSVVGLCYLLSLILSIILISISVLFFIGDKVMSKKIIKKIVKIVLIILCFFYFFAFIINIITAITQQGTVFYVYILTELLKLIVLIVIFVIHYVQTKKKEETKNEEIND